MDERTQEILNRFHKSWLETENFYDRLLNDFKGWDQVEPIRELIKRLKENGDDNFFRLGTSMHALLISRSVNFGLRAD